MVCRACEGLSGPALQETARVFVEVFAKRGELSKIREVIRRLTTVVVAESAHPLKPSIRKSIEAAADGTVKEIVRPELIGGLKLRVNDRIIDGTIAGQLDRLRRKLSE